MTQPAKLLLLVGLLSNDKLISNNSKTYLKELILRNDPKLISILQRFESKNSKENQFLEEIHKVIKQESCQCYDQLFYDTPLDKGKTLSKLERESKQLNEERSLIYGEIEFQSFYDVLRTINSPAGKVFYDLGSGTGKALFVARLTQDYSKCIGIEILEGLHKQAELVLNRYRREYQSQLYCNGIGAEAEVYHGSFLDYDWSDGDVIFANSTCFDDSLMYQFAKQAHRLKPGSIVVTFTKSLPQLQNFEIIQRRRYKMSWGPATVFIHVRLENNNTRPANFPSLVQFNSDVDYQEDNISTDDDSNGPPTVKVYPLSTPTRNRGTESSSDTDGLTSPQDTALIKRKRANRAAQA